MLPVVQHCSVDKSRSVVCKCLQVLVMCGDDSRYAFIVQLHKNRLSQCTSYLRLGAGTHLVCEDKCLVIRIEEKMLHISQM